MRTLVSLWEVITENQEAEKGSSDRGEAGDILRFNKIFFFFRVKRLEYDNFGIRAMEKLHYGYELKSICEALLARLDAT